MQSNNSLVYHPWIYDYTHYAAKNIRSQRTDKWTAGHSAKYRSMVLYCAWKRQAHDDMAMQVIDLLASLDLRDDASWLPHAQCTGGAHVDDGAKTTHEVC